MDDDDDDIHGDHRPPLFAHECIGMDDDDDDESREVPDAEEDRDDGRANSTVEYDVDDIDLNDPTLEAFLQP